MDYLSMCYLEQSYILLIVGRSSSNKDLLKQSKITSSQDPPWISPQDFYPLKSLSKVLVQVFLKKEEFSWASKSKFQLLRISHPLWALSLFLVMMLSYHCFQGHKSS
jgi:hypothetical protein